MAAETAGNASLLKNESETHASYFSSYASLEVQRLMIADEPRTRTYREAIEKNAHLFKGKTVLDVGAGTGILSFFACRAGAKKVHSVEKSEMARCIPRVAAENGLLGKIIVHNCLVEDLKLPEKVDIIISEWMGMYLFNESMLQSVLVARDNLLKSDGIMFPFQASLYLAPANFEKFWQENVYIWDSFYGFDFTAAKRESIHELCTQSKCEIINPETLIGPQQLFCQLDLMTITLDDIEAMTNTFKFEIQTYPSKFDGLCSWFTVTFPNDVVLNTSPFHDPTHWKQTLFFFPTRLEITEKNQKGIEFTLIRNERKYEFKITVSEVENEI